MPSSQLSQTALSSVANRPKRGGGGAVATLVAAQQDSEQKMQKLIATIEKLQQENAQVVAQAGQAGGSAAQNVANQVARGFDKAATAQQRSSERAEDKAFSREQQQLNASLQKDAARAAAQMGAAINASRQKYMDSVHKIEADEAAFDEAITTYEARIEQASVRGVFANPEGRKKLAKMESTIRMARIHKDNMFDDRHIQKAYRLWNKEMKSITSNPDDPFAAMNAATDPINLPMIEMQGENRDTPDTMGGEEKFWLELASGYPENGVMFDQPGNNFNLPEGVNPNIFNPRTMLDLMSDFEHERMITDKSLLQEYKIGAQRQMIENMDRINGMKETYKSINLVYGTKSAEAIEAAMEDFLQDQNPAKLNNSSRYLMTRSLVHVFGGGAKGEEMAILGMEFFDGKREARSEADFAMLMAMESASFQIQKRFATEVLNADGTTGASFASIILGDMEQKLGKDQMLRQLGIDPSGGAAMVEALSTVQDLVLETRGMARRMNNGMKNSGLLKQFKGHYVSTLQRMDIQAYRMNKENEQVVNRLGVMVDQLNRTPEQGGAGLDDLQSAEEMRRGDFLGSITLVDGFIGLYGDMSPDMHEQISSVLVNKLDPVTTANASGFAQQTKMGREADGYTNAAASNARNWHDETIKNRQRATEAEAAQTESPGEAFDRGGAGSAAASAVRNLVPLVGMAAGRMGTVGVNTLRGAGKVFGGNPLKEKAELGAGILKGELPLMTPTERRQIQGNLTPSEISQVTFDSQEPEA